MTIKILAVLTLAAMTSGCASYTAEKWPCERTSCQWSPINQGSVVQ